MQMGFEYGQGYLLGKPLPVEEWTGSAAPGRRVAAQA
jgi:EAL domain-containing protein (putative c-di-GMP-specific phosphodiesterase class I)